MSLFVFFISLLIVAQHVSGNHVPIIRSWRLRHVIASCWYVPWLQEGCQDRLAGSASMDVFVLRASYYKNEKQTFKTDELWTIIVSHSTNYITYLLSQSLLSLFQSGIIRTAQYAMIHLRVIQSAVWLHNIWDIVLMKTHTWEPAIWDCPVWLVDVHQTGALLPWRQRHYISPKC